jgi:hypothetical protein
MNEYGNYYQQILCLLPRYDPLGNGIRHSLGHCHLCRTKDLGCLIHVLHSHFGND